MAPAYVASALVAITTLLLIVTPTPTSALSSCDINTSNITVGYSAASFAIFNCTTLPFTTEEIPFVYTITANAAYRAYFASGEQCQRGNFAFGDFACSSNPSCSQHGYLGGATNYDATPNTNNVWCLIVTSYYSFDVTVDNITIEYSPARVETQWHLTNTGQFGGTSGNDVNATGAWAQGAYGNGVVIMISDVGVQKTHVEVSERFVLSLSWNPELATRDPTAFNQPLDDHGTACAGVAAAAINAYCGQGIAPQASVAGYRVFGTDYVGTVATYVRGMYVDEKSTDGTNRRVSVHSNSWGPSVCTPFGCRFAALVPPIVASIQYGADTGRGGLGVVYLFAAGNDAYYGGDVNLGSYSKLPEVMTIGASDFNGKRVYYSNPGAALFVNAPSQGQEDPDQGLWPGIATAQFSISTSSCMGTFGGTSSSTPLVAGIIAQILGVRPDLTYRDVQHIIQKTADRNDPLSLQWLQNGAGVWFSHHSGFGRINAGNAVALAGNWTKLGGSCGISTSIKTVGTTIPDNSPLTPVTSTFTLVAGTASLPDTLESVTVYVSIAHAYPHDLRIKLTSPQGTTAILARPAATRYSNTLTTLYPLAARIFWGESPVGIWTIAITDEIAADTGVFNNWALEVQGAGNGTIPDRLYGAAPASRSMTMVITLGAMISAIVALFA